MIPDATYDVFLSHATPDKPEVEELARRLKRRKLKPFLDKWHLVPGEPWQEALEEALGQSRSLAVFLGPAGIGPWQNAEMRNALARRMGAKSRRVIPVLLPGASIPDQKTLPPFLEQLTWVDFRSGLDDAEPFRLLVCGIRGIRPGKGRASIPQSPPRALPTMIGVPHRNPYFTGRKELLSQLHQQLQTQEISTLAQAVLNGLGGIGKTQTAIEYAHLFGEHYSFVLWVMAQEEEAIRAAYLSIARKLELVEEQADLERAILAVNAWLSREAGWLLIFDNADDPALLRNYLPVARAGGKVLLTSRAKCFAYVGISEPFRLPTMNPEDAVAFLLKRTRHDEPGPSAELSRALGHLPLALEQAAAYIDTVGVSLNAYLASFKRRGLQLLEKGKAGADYPDSVATIWNLSFSHIKKASPASAELLTAAAFLLPDSTPIEIFTGGGSELGDLLARGLKGVVEDPLIFWELLAPLERYSLVESLPDDAVKLHRLTQEVLKDSLDDESRRTWAERVVRALNAVYPEVEFKNWQLCERLQPNARQAVELARTYKLEFAGVGRLFRVAGKFAWARGDHAGAKLFEELSLEICERLLGAEHPDTLTSRNNLAEALGSLGDLAGAKKLHEEILEIRERVLGNEHSDTLTSRSNLAATLDALGDLAGARELFEQTLEIRERLLGAEHPDTLTSRNNLAETLRGLGDLAGAKQFQEQTLAISERVLGSEHPDTLGARNNLAGTLDALGDLTGARDLFEQTLEIRERVLGAEHPDTLHSRNNLAGILYALGDLAGARELFEQVLEIEKCVLGPEHPDTLRSRNNLAGTLYALGDLADSRQLFEQTLEISERMLGGEHPDTTMSIWNLLLTVHLLKDADTVAQLIEKLRWLLDRDEVSILSATQREIRQRLFAFLSHA